MVRKLVFIALCVLSFFSSRAQNYIPLIDTTSSWDIGIWKMGGISYPAAPKRYFISGDTVINSVTYSKFYYYTSTNETNSPPWWPPFYVDSVPHPAHIYIREDTAQRLVYSYNYNGDWLLFDFNLVEGDEFYGIIVDTVYYRTFADGLTRKVIDFDYDGSSQFALIEGIGGNCGPMEPPCYHFENFTVPICFKRNGMRVFYSGCSDMISVNASHIEIPEITYYPNPVVDILYIQSPFGSELYDIKVIDVLGHQIIKSTASGTASINFVGLSKGMYFISISSKKKVYNFKTIKC